MSYGGVDEHTKILGGVQGAPSTAAAREAGYLCTAKETAYAIVVLQVAFFAIFQLYGHVGVMVRLNLLSEYI